MKENFKKSDLKTGMIVQHKNGEKSLVMKDNSYGSDALVFTENSWTELEDFGEHDLMWHFNGNNGHHLDIVKVYKPDLPTGFLTRRNKFSSELALVWERKEEKPILTLDGVEYSESTLRSLIKKATNSK